MPTGSCMCGAVAYEYSGDPKNTALCHCTDCQKWSGAAYTSNIVVPRSVFKVTKGTPKQYDATGDSGKINAHFFCGDCGSSLYTKLELLPDDVCIKSGGIDDKAIREHAVGMEFYTKDRLKYSTPIEGATQVYHFG